ncbi:uncharacterized protein LOC143180275 [Calliopsis andreniformis]|uniref:uncharacterized protein LOC143180275 n=1 Tax=Calliopsis andreniformis TaxID=337506 RepID=UPI003FCE95C3
MSRSSEKVARKWSLEAPQKNGSSSTDELSSTSKSSENSPYAKNTSTPLKSKWNLEQINRSPRNSHDVAESEDTEDESSDEEKVDSFQSRKELPRTERGKHQDERERRQKARRDHRERRRHSRRTEDFGNETRKETSGSQSSEKRHERGDAVHSRRKKGHLREEDELPITEILKRSQEDARTKYEHQPPFPELTTDKIYVQHRGSFSAMKINRLRDSRGGRKTENNRSNENIENRNSPPIRVAITAQKLWKSIGFVSQGILGGMALMHFIMLSVFFNVSMDFVINHSSICEIYTSIFSFLIALCIVSTFDKFDLARLNVEHLREIYLDYNKSIFAVPLYLIIFCLHQVCLNTDNQLSLVHYYSLNDSLWENATNVHTFLDDLNAWQKMSMSKDILAVFAWLFVSLGTKDDAFLIHLQTMKKYADETSPSR